MGYGLSFVAYLVLIASLTWRLYSSSWSSEALTLGLLAGSSLGYWAWALAKSPDERVRVLLRIAPAVGALASIPLIPHHSQIPSCLACAPKTTAAVIGGIFSLCAHLLAAALLSWPFRGSRTLIGALGIVGSVGQTLLIWQDPKFCPFCIVSGLCFLTYWRQAMMPTSAVSSSRLRPSLVLTLLLFCTVSSTLRASFVGEKPKQGSTAFEGRPFAEVVPRAQSKSRLVFIAVPWCSACQQIPDRLTKTHTQASILYPCLANQQSDCHELEQKIEIFPTLFIVDNRGVIQRQITGLPSEQIFEELVKDAS